MVQRPWQSAQTLLLLTDAPWQQENFALDFHAHKMPVGLTLQELCTNAVSWESSVGLRTFFPLSTKTSRVWRTKKKKTKKTKPREKQISMRHAHPNLSSLQACTATAYPAIQICIYWPHKLLWWCEVSSELTLGNHTYPCTAQAPLQVEIAWPLSQYAFIWAAAFPLGIVPQPVFWTSFALQYATQDGYPCSEEPYFRRASPAIISWGL